MARRHLVTLGKGELFANKYESPPIAEYWGRRYLGRTSNRAANWFTKRTMVAQEPHQERSIRVKMGNGI